MILYRGTPVPQTSPASKSYECVFFAPNFGYAAEYAAGERADPGQDHGFVQKYRLPKQRILDIGERETFDLFERLTGRRPGRWSDEAMLSLFWDPSRKWIELVKSKGYTGTSMGDNVCIFDVSEAKFLGQWKVWPAGRLRAGRLEFVRERIG